LTSKWDNKYLLAAEAGLAVNVLTENEHLLPINGGKALDLACGLGANALLLAKNNFDVMAWDSSGVAIEKLTSFAQQQNTSLVAQQRDVSLEPPEPESFDVIVVSYFLERAICADIVSSLKPNGLLFYQTYCQQKVVDTGPSNPDFLLKENELLALFSDLNVRFYREEALAGNHHLGWRNQAMLVAQKAA
jgi:2-polyprenyl-3-methyl-5-hydroxy-6-metoxy-1,4-benzoquinol methylase